MSGGGIARRYVQPLFEAAQERQALDQIFKDLKALDEALSGSPDLKTFLHDPSLGRSVKKRALEALFKGAHPFTINFLRVVVDKNRAEILVVAFRLFKEMMNAARGVETGVVNSAVVLDDKAFREIKTSLEAGLKKKLELDREVDPELLGGLRIQIGNTVFDHSVQGRLARLRDALAGA